MNMTTCHVCGKVFGSTGAGACPNCRKLLDIVYEKARAYLRDNPKVQPSTQELAAAIGEDVRLVEILRLEGRFDTTANDTPLESAEEKKRKQLLEDLQKNLTGTSKDKPSQQSSQSTGTYGSDRHGRGI